MSSYLSIFHIEHASFVLRVVNIYACLSLSRQVMPSFEARYLHFGCKMLLGGAHMGSHPKYKKCSDSWECSFGNQLNAAVA